MSLLKLSLSERRALQKQIHNTKDVKVLKRAQALLYLADGVSAQEIAKRLGVTRRTIYGWVSLYQNRCNKSVKDRLKDRPKPGRPPKKSTHILPELEHLLHNSPRQHGYRYSEWTSCLLKQVMKSEHTLDVSTKTIRRCLKQLHYVWKRPAYALARQAPTWAQAKGG
ncbi:MAG: helix-turn-helix domain-containing protein [Candidatus Tectomicrobia bacterium]